MASNKVDTDNIINQLINSKGKNVKLKEKDISVLLKTARDIFMEQPAFLELEAPIKICGKFNVFKSRLVYSCFVFCPSVPIEYYISQQCTC